VSTVDDVDELIEQYQLAIGEFMKGNPEPVKRLVSHREDVTLNNPLGPPVRGWEQVAEATEHAASQVRDGELTSVEIVAKYVTAELALRCADRAVKGQGRRKGGDHPVSSAGYDDLST
jgi:hypothetical protein